MEADQSRCMPGFLAGLLLGACLCLAAWPVHAQPGVREKPEYSWLCWVVPDDIISIRCIRKTSFSIAPALQDDDNAAEENLALLNINFETGINSRELETLFQFFQDSFVSGDYWVIPIYVAPYEESWQTEWPQQLVRAALCRRNSICRVSFQRN